MRPVLYVLAGVNGAGKSSVGGHLLTRAGLDWYNPDAFARALVSRIGVDQTVANGIAWQEGMRRLDAAITARRSFAFETTLGGETVALKIGRASDSHDVLMWFVGLSSPELHIARVRARVAAGGHDIPEVRIRQRYTRAIENLIGLMPQLARLKILDNSLEAVVGSEIADPVVVAYLAFGKITSPITAASLHRVPEWAKPILAAALAKGD